MISLLERTFLPAATSAEWRQGAPPQHPLNVTDLKTLKQETDLDPLRVLHVKVEMRLICWTHRLKWWQHFYVEIRMRHQCGGSSSYLFDFPLMSRFYSLLYLLSTSHQRQVFVLPAPIIPHPERAAAVALPQGCFHEGVGREGLAYRYEQTVTTDGSRVATVLARPHCSLPHGWSPRPINPKPCHLFSSLWIQRGSCEGCFTGFLT